MKRTASLFLRRMILCAALVSMVWCTAASAAVPTFVTNKQNEIQQLIETFKKNDWLNNMAFNLQGLESLMGLVDMVKNVEGVLEGFDIQNIIGSLASEMSGELLGEINKQLAGSGLEGIGGKLAKGILGAIQTGNVEGVFNDLKGELVSILKEKGTAEAAKIISERMRKGGEAAIGDASDSVKAPASGVPGVAPEKLFVKEGDKYVRTLPVPGGKPVKETLTREEMEKKLRSEGGGWWKESDGSIGGIGVGGTYSPADMAAAGEKATDAATAYMEQVNKYNPAILPANQGAIVASAIEATAATTINERNLLLLSVAQEQKNLALQGLASIVAKYTDPEKSYRAGVNTSLDQYKDTLEKAKGLSSKTSPGEALQAVAGLLSVQVEQLNTQNILLVGLSDVMADEILLLDRLANLMLENYSDSLYNNLKERGSQLDSYRQTLR